MSSALDECLRILEEETNLHFPPKQAMETAVLELSDYDERKGFLERLDEYHLKELKRALMEDNLTEYGVLELKKGVPMKKLAETATRYYMIETLQNFERCDSGLDVCDSWIDFLINYWCP